MAGVRKMEVNTSSGPSVRAVDHVDATGRRIPKLRKDEHLVWFVGNIVPSIIQTGASYTRRHSGKYGF